MFLYQSIIFLSVGSFLDVEEFSDFVSSLGTESSGFVDVSKSYDFLFSFFDEDEGKDSDIRSDNATSDTLSLFLTSTSRSVCAVTFSHKKSDSTLDESTLFHGETILIVSSTNFKDISFVFGTE